MPVADQARRLPQGVVPILTVGVAAFLIACLSLLDMFLPRPYDGVVVDPNRGDLVIQSVRPGSGSAEAGLRPGDRIIGLARQIVRSHADAARALQQQRIGDRVPYLVERHGQLLEREVLLGPRRLGTGLYLYACFAGFLFFFIGLFVFLQQPPGSERSPAQVFFILATLFMLFLVCRLRPASYSWVDHLVITTGNLSLLALPAAFLHFFLVFPRRFTISLGAIDDGARNARGLTALERFLNSPRLITLVYVLPPLLYGASLAAGALLDIRVRMVSGAPLPSWVLMGDYLILGLLALFASMLRATEGRERRQIATLFAGTVLGVTPFLVLGVGFPSLLRDDRFLLLGVMPMLIVPLTFGYAIVRFQFFNIRVIVRRSLLYTLTTAVVAVAYAVGIAAFNLLFRDASLGRSPYYPVVLALAILALFDPLRRRLQEPVDRFFFRESYDARRAIEEMAESVVREITVERIEEILTARLAQVMHLEWAVLFVQEGESLMARGSLAGAIGPIRRDLVLVEEVTRRNGPQRLVQLETVKLLEERSSHLLGRLAAVGTRLVVPLAARGSLYGLLLLGGKRSEAEFQREDLQLVRTLANQAAVALENAELLKERTRQAALEKELEIARRVQFSLIPDNLVLPPGWEVAAHCEPAQQVGGDFYDVLPGPQPGSSALILGDVSGKSVAGAMRMVAAREVLHTAALAGTSPEELLATANRRLYNPQPRLFVALAYLLVDGHGSVRFALAGQPAPLLRRPSGEVVELVAPQHRLPLGALREGEWDLREATLEAGDMLLLYSDGLTDARGRSGEPFGEERLVQLVADTAGSPTATVARLRSTLASYTAGAEPYDDITVVAVRFAGAARA